ncbi:MAG: sigma 54-interacting transcriptional regulator, partial [Spirochaetota bacterium]
FESELFGHSRGAFTGAVDERRGIFKAAEGGTLFLDEVAEIPVHLQAKLLRTIERGEIRAIGRDGIEKVDVRIIAATNRHLEEEIKKGNFREDLFFRLNQVPVYIPPLRQRREDIPGFLSLFAREIERKNGLKRKEFTPAALDYLKNRRYNGNIRELRNLIERVMILADSDVIDGATLKTVDAASLSREEQEILFSTTMPLKEAKKFLEQKYIKKQLAKFNFSVKDTAAALEILPNNLSRKVHGFDSEPGIFP